MNSSATSFASWQPSTGPCAMMRTRPVRTVSLSPFRLFRSVANCSTGGQIGHRKYDCPEQRNFTANIICRVCGNAGHMARDCPDRQRGADWRNGPPSGGYPGRAPHGAGRIGGGDAVDREYEVIPNPMLLSIAKTNPPLSPLTATHARIVWWRAFGRWCPTANRSRTGRRLRERRPGWLWWRRP
jgi:hypothetical protein